MQMVASLLHKESLLTTAEPVTVALAEEVKLFLPSSVPVVLWNSMKNVAAKELRLRKAQADESLEDIRRGRRMITGLTQFKKLNICASAGNKPNTRMQTLYNRLQRRIKRAANCYQAARNALYQLEPDGGTWKDRYRELDIKDIRAYAAHQAKKLELLAESCIQKWLPALSGANIVVDWGVLEMAVDSKTDENDEDGEWFNDEDEEENDDDPFDSYELDDWIMDFI